MAKKKSTHPDTLGYNREIGKRVKELTRAGVPVKAIFAEIQKFSNAPGSYSTLYKYYGTDMEQARAALGEIIGNKQVDFAINGDEDNPLTHKAREFVLERKLGWNKKETVETREVGTEDAETESAVANFMSALGLDDED